ncbi:hypothetical protein NDU88_003329 [Pleurodeles waltl]|uniref:Uncharacterized protein n=1 Tax=Pleurodeles waltl TaxID=8319 RepID=A0AAV7UFW4_PLEWA|nr:hypothetical protein NDU88_003329 [Pleurodeles waltl]
MRAERSSFFRASLGEGRSAPDDIQASRGPTGSEWRRRASARPLNASRHAGPAQLGNEASNAEHCLPDAAWQISCTMKPWTPSPGKALGLPVRAAHRVSQLTSC